MQTIKIFSIAVIMLSAQSAIAANNSATKDQAGIAHKNAISHCTMLNNACFWDCTTGPDLPIVRKACFEECANRYNKCVDKEMALYKKQVRREKWTSFKTKWSRAHDSAK